MIMEVVTNIDPHTRCSLPYLYKIIIYKLWFSIDQLKSIYGWKFLSLWLLKTRFVSFSWISDYIKFSLWVGWDTYLDTQSELGSTSEANPLLKKLGKPNQQIHSVLKCRPTFMFFTFHRAETTVTFSIFVLRVDFYFSAEKRNKIRW